MVESFVGWTSTAPRVLGVRLIEVRPGDVLVAVVRADAEIVAEVLREVDLRLVDELAVDDVLLRARREERLPEVLDVEARVRAEAVPEDARGEALRVEVRRDVARGERREDDVVERTDAEHLERALGEAAADAERAELSDLARAARVEADRARALDLIADAGAHVGAAVRHLARQRGR
jgi:hypothetical protein